MRQFLDRLYLVSGLLGAAFIVAIFGIVLLQVGANLLDFIYHAITGNFFGFVIPSYADFAGFFLVGSVFLALAYTFRHGGHIRVSLLVQAMPKTLRHLADIFSMAVALALSVYFTYFAVLLVHESWTYGDTSTGLVAVPLWIPQLVMVAGGLVLCVALLDSLQQLLRGQKEPATNHERTDEEVLEEEMGHG